jgi:TonB family protein
LRQVTTDFLQLRKARIKRTSCRSVEGIAAMRNAILLLVCFTASSVAQEERTLTWLHVCDPAYPQMARIAHISGRVILEITVQPSGEFTVSKAIGHPILVQAAKDSVQKSKLKCEGCGDEQHTFSIAYEFKIDDPSPPSPPVAKVAPVRRQGDRSIRCLYLWRCGSIWFY